MKAILVRVGVDHSFGGWNAPVDPVSGEFVYVPIPESPGTQFRAAMRRDYAETLPALERFAAPRGLDLYEDLQFPRGLLDRSMHLDPDFSHLTYGDDGLRRGSQIRLLKKGDLLVFYAGLRSVRPGDQRLVYALVGQYVVDAVVSVADIPEGRWSENAHTRKARHASGDIVVRARPGVSGRLQRCIPIGEHRDRAYRVRRDVLEAWGGLSVEDGYIQRSARPPTFVNPRRFYDWFQHKDIPLAAANNPTGKPKLIVVMLRRPRKNNPAEQRDEPFWEFGSFGCTRCHERTLLHPAKAQEADGARLAFAQGGPDGGRLVYLSPPVWIIPHGEVREARWEPAEMPFKYAEAPVLIDNNGHTDFPGLKPLLESVRQPSWEASFASAFRSRRNPLDPKTATEIIKTYTVLRAEGRAQDIASNYVEALPYPPPRIDHSRRRTYNALIRNARGRRKIRRCREQTPRRC